MDTTFKPESRKISDNEYEVKFYAELIPGDGASRTRADLLVCTIIVTVDARGEPKSTQVTRLGWYLMRLEELEARRGRFEEEAREFIRPQTKRTNLN